MTLDSSFYKSATDSCIVEKIAYVLTHNICKIIILVRPDSLEVQPDKIVSLYNHVFQHIYVSCGHELDVKLTYCNSEIQQVL